VRVALAVLVLLTCEVAIAETCTIPTDDEVQARTAKCLFSIDGKPRMWETFYEEHRRLLLQAYQLLNDICPYYVDGKDYERGRRLIATAN
jgi:hypothetical protein